MILQNTTLCTIVREEEVNPAGGIADFIDSTVPYMQEAVLVDTGSKLDKTKEILEEAKKRHPNLRVFHTTFKGFDIARKVSLDHATTNWVICLDADERIKSEDFATLADYHRARTRDPNLFGYNIPIMDVFPDGKNSCGTGFNPKVFSRERVGFLGRLWEYPSIKGSMKYLEVPDSAPVKIWHFVPDYKERQRKKELVYEASRFNEDEGVQLGNFPSPLSFPDSIRWKQPNAHREAYR